MPIWYNQDGLLVKTGREEAVSGTAGTYEDYVAGNQVLEVNLDLTKLTTSSTILDDFIHWPKGWKIEQVEIYVETAATSGGSATLSVGFTAADRVTAVDNTGILNAIPLSTLSVVGNRITYRVGTTGVGTQVGLALANPGAYINGVAGTAVFTGGLVKVRVFYHKP